MKAKLFLLLAGLAVSGFVLNGCYTQIARPDGEDEPRYAEEPQTADDEVITENSEEAAVREEADRPYDYRHRTDVYVYGGGWYGSPWYPYGYPSWYAPYPRSGFYVSVGYGYYDQWNWCGTGWDWYDPWCHNYYYPGSWGYYGWRPSHYYYPHYYPYYAGSGKSGVPAKKRTIGRRGSSVSDEVAGAIPTATSTRGTLFRPSSSTYTRDNDGSYRRVRRDETGSASTVQRAGSTNKSSSQGQSASNGRRVSKRGSSNSGNSDRTAVSRGSSGNSSGRGNDSGSRGSSGGSVSKPSGSSGGSSAPKSSGGSSSSGSSSGRRTRN